MMDFLLNLDKFWKQVIVLLVDIIICTLSLILAYYLRLEYVSFLYNDIKVFVISYLIFIPIFIFFGLYNTIFRFSGINTLTRILYAVIFYMLIFFSLLFLLKIENVPKSVSLIQPIIFFLLISFSRFFIASILRKKSFKFKKIKLAIYGAGTNTYQYLQYFNDYDIKLIFDDDRNKIGRKLNNVKICDSKFLNAEVKKENVTHLFVIIPNILPDKKKYISQNIGELNLIVRFLPDFKDFLSNQITLSEIKQLNIEDLISNKISINKNNIFDNELKNKSVLVTGAGGSIGGELCRQLFNCQISEIILFENNEYNLYSINNELEKLSGNIKIYPVLGSINEYAIMASNLKNFTIDYIFHAAAYKHVPLLEINVLEAARNNIIGSFNLINFAIEKKCKKVLLISTDKAVRPTNVMGASKRLAENIFQSFSTLKSDTIFSIVRFGNVVNSKGSALPLFQEQIEKKLPITITDPNVSRYFMTIPDAAKLIIEANFLSSDTNKCNIYFLDMGKSIKILDLVKKMVNLYGLTLIDKNNKYGDVEIKYIGLRPGEKLKEELVIGDHYSKTSNKNILVCNESFIDYQKILDICRNVDKAIIDNDSNLVLEIFKKHVEGFSENI